MAKTVLTAEYTFFNAVDLSTYCRKAEIQVKTEAKDVTNYGSGGWHERIGGLKEASIVLEFEQDFAAGNLDSILWPLLGTVIAFELRPTQGVRTTSNPAWTGNLLVTDWNPITGAVGDDAKVSVTFPSTGVILRQTS